MSIAIIKYNAGNIFSVESAFNRLGAEVVVTSDHKLIKQADKVIFPGVGEAASTMAHLHENGLDQLIPTLQQPVLGICLGMQLMCRYSEEGNAECLNIFDTDVKRFVPKTVEDKIPHIGWNRIYGVQEPLFDSTLENQYVYFVHSFYVPVNNHTIATTDYTLPYSAALNKGNFFATQFHPEKSGDIGERILKNFLSI